MNAFSREELQLLVEAQQGPCVSIFLPTHRAGMAYAEDRIRLRNRLHEARRRLTEQGLRAPDVEALLAPAQALLSDSCLWRHCLQGLAIYMSPTVCRHYCLPMMVDDRLVVASHFDFEPLVPLLTEERQFYLLALSQKRVRFFHGTRETMSELQIKELPGSVAELYGTEKPVQRDLQFRCAVPGGRGGGSIMFYRAGDAGQAARARLLTYCRRIDHALEEPLRDNRLPVVLAGVDYLVALFREVTHHRERVAGVVSGCPDRLSAQALHARAWELLQSEPDLSLSGQAG
jgi:hypothetical protein